MGPIITQSFTATAGTTQEYTVTVQKYWNYDSLFIWAWSPDSVEPPKIAYDEGTPYDGYRSTDAVTWTPRTIRVWIKVEYAGQTVGDIPVSGIINVIEIPRSASQFENTGISVPQNTETTLITVNGTGYCDSIILQSGSSDYPHQTMFRIYCDGVLADAFTPYILDNLGMAANTQPYCLIRYETTAGTGICNIMVTQRYEFTREFKITATNYNADAYCTAKIVANLIK